MPKLGLIDIGTNTLRLVIGESDATGKPHFLCQQVIATRLGEGLSRTGELEAQSIERTIQGLKELQSMARSHKVDTLEAYATAWARKASNTDVMMSRLAEINLPIWILTEQEEALMGLEAVKLMNEQRFSQETWIIDIGGGSTEFVRSSQNKPLYCKSIPMGAVNFTEKFLQEDPPLNQLESAQKEANRAFQDLSVTAGEEVIAIGGTVASLGALKLKLVPTAPQFFEQCQGLILEKSFILQTLHQLCELPLEDRKKLPGMESERADILPGGTMLLLALLDKLLATRVKICLYSFIHGLLAKRLEIIHTKT